MPHSDPEKAKIYRRQYNLAARDKYRKYRQDHKAEYSIHYRAAAWKRRGIINLDGTPFTVPDFNFWMEVQNDRCAICRIERNKLKTNFAADHNHQTGIIRGLLCALCNRFVVFTVENHKSLISKAIDYLRITNNVSTRTNQPTELGRI